MRGFRRLGGRLYLPLPKLRNGAKRRWHTAESSSLHEVRREVEVKAGRRAHGHQLPVGKGCFEVVRRALDFHMTKAVRDPIAIVAQASKADLVRQVALELKMSYEELPVLGQSGLIRFRFPPMTSEDELKLMFAVPREAYCQAVFVGSKDPREADL